MESKIMKKQINRVLFWGSIAAFAVGVAIILEGCAAVGPNPTPPTKAESLIFNTVTNYQTVVIPAYVTNQVQVQSFQTNVQGVVVTQYLTNTVPITVPAQTNQMPTYTETVKPSVKEGIQGAGGILNFLFPGWGSAVSNGLIAALMGWAYARSQKQGANTTATLAQEIEVIRSILQSLPNGAALDNQFVTWIQNHQAEAGILTQVMGVLANKVKNNDAQTAAQQISQAVQALVTSTAPPKV